MVWLILWRSVRTPGLRVELAGLRIVAVGRLTLLVVAHKALPLAIAVAARRVPLATAGVITAEPGLPIDFAAMDLSASFNPNARLRNCAFSRLLIAHCRVVDEPRTGPDEGIMVIRHGAHGLYKMPRNLDRSVPISLRKRASFVEWTAIDRDHISGFPPHGRTLQDRARDGMVSGGYRSQIPTGVASAVPPGRAAPAGS